MPKYTPVLLLAMIAGFIAYAAFAPASKIVPNLEMQNLKGEVYGLNELEAPRLISFWATTCSTCIAEMPHLVDLNEKLGPLGLKTIGVAMSYDNIDDINQLVEARGLSYDIVYDSDGSIAKTLGPVRATPTTLLIDPKGRVVMTKLGFIDFEALEKTIREML